MQDHSIKLHDGSEVISDVLFCGTGWDPHYPFFTKAQAVKMGLSHACEDDEPEESQEWDAFSKIADQRIIAQFPQLANPPPHVKSPAKPNRTATRLYNCIAPLGDTSIAFMGDIHLHDSFRTAEAQAIWTTAYFDGNVKLPPLKEAKQEIAYMTAFCKRRYPSRGGAGNYFHTDLVPYTDKLMKDIGLKSHRKGWWKDLVYPCLISDLKGMKDEYLAKFGPLE